MQRTNHQVRLAARPSGLPQPDVWQHTEEPVPEPGDGQVLVRVTHLSLDPAMRGRMNAGRSYVEPVGIGEVMRALAAGEVVSSQHPRLSPGDLVTGPFGVQEYATVNGDAAQPADVSGVPLPTHLAALGITGMTAYFGLLDVGALHAGDTVVVSGAAGAVGSIVGQIARIKGARAVGIAGGPEKCRWLTEELGFDAAIDYREDPIGPALREHAPDGVDVYFDNVGGETLDAVLAWLARGARVVICGAISQYNNDRFHGPKNYFALLVQRARMEGFLVFDYVNRYPEAAEVIAGWLREGKLRSREEVVDGTVADFPETFLRLFRGENVGKLVLRIGGS